MITEDLLVLGVCGAMVSILGIIASARGLILVGYRRHVDKLWVRWDLYQIDLDHEKALSLDAVITDLHVLDRKVHYRHNVHCHVCGRFSRQAEGWPAGVANCNEHGLGTRTLTGAIPVILMSTTPLTLSVPEPLELMIEQ